MLSFAWMLVLLFASTAGALNITVSDADATYHDRGLPCTIVSTATVVPFCYADAHLTLKAIEGDNAEFGKAFNAWNATNAANAKWTLINGGAIDGLALDVSLFRTSVVTVRSENDAAEVEIQVNVTIGDNSTRDKYFWVQGLYDNYIGSGFAAPKYEMDIRAAGCDNSLSAECPPVYPTQYADRRFYDKPTPPEISGFFEANALLAQVDRQNRKLTVYQGVNYGVVASAPEPASVLLTGGALLLWGIGRQSLRDTRSASHSGRLT